MKRVLQPAAVALLVVATGCPSSSEIEHGNVAFDISPDGGRIVFSAVDGDLYVLHLETRRVERLTTTDEVESKPKFSPDGRSVVFSTSVGDAKSKIAVLALDTKRVRLLTNPDDASDSSAAFSGDGKRITFARAHRRRQSGFGGVKWDDYDIYVINEEGSDCRRLTQKKYYGASSPRLMADGKSAIFTGETNDYPKSTFPVLLEVAIDDSKPPATQGAEPRIKGPEPTGSLRIGAWVSDSSVSLDNKLITFISDRSIEFNYDIYIMTTAGADVRPLGVTTVSRYNQQPVFLPDCKGIMFLAGTESNQSSRPVFSLWKVGLDGRKPSRIADSKLFTDPLHWPWPSSSARPTAVRLEE